MQLRSIRRSHIEAWVKNMSSRLAATTIDTRFTIVRGVFRAAVADRLIARDPTAGVVLPRKRKAEAAMAIPASADVAKVLRAAEPERRPRSRPGFTAYVALCAFAGLRRGEALGVQVGDIDFLGRPLRVGAAPGGEPLVPLGVCLPAAVDDLAGVRTGLRRVLERRSASDVTGPWHRLATSIMRRPVLWFIAAGGLMAELKYRWVKWKMNRLRRRFEQGSFIPPFGLDQALIALGTPDISPERPWRYSSRFHLRRDLPVLDQPRDPRLHLAPDRRPAEGEHDA